VLRDGGSVWESTVQVLTFLSFFIIFIYFFNFFLFLSHFYFLSFLFLDRSSTHRSASASLSVKFRPPMSQLRVFLNYPVIPQCICSVLIPVSGASLGGGQRSEAGFFARVSQTRLASTVGGASRSTTVISSGRLGCCRVLPNPSSIIMID